MTGQLAQLKKQNLIEVQLQPEKRFFVDLGIGKPPWYHSP